MYHKNKDNALPRLQSQVKKSNKLSAANNARSTPASAVSKPTSSKLASDGDDALAREAEILSLMTVLNAPVINEELPATLQAIKAALFARDFMAAFSRPDYLRAYCARWVPGRALAYRNLLWDCEPLVELFQRSARQSHSLRTICIGGGAGSEVLAFTSFAREAGMKDLRIEAVDIAEWKPILDDMAGLFSSRWDIPPNEIQLGFTQANILEDFSVCDFASANVITSLFTTNELLAASRPKTLSLFSHMSEVCQSGTLFLVVESVGTYSEISLGGKTYPLTLVLDQALAGRDKPWRIVKKEEGRWYRVPEESRKRYKLQLENTHMMVRLYEKR